MSQENDVDEPNEFRGIEKGEFVALGLDEFKDELPQIARVLMTQEDLITAEWWVGTYSGTWTSWTVTSVEQTLTVHRNCIVSLRHSI